MEKNCVIAGEMGDLLPIKRPREDQSSSESQPSSGSPVVAKPMRNDTNWAELFVKEITSASDPDNARIRAAESLKSFEAFLRDGLISEVKRNLVERAKKFPLEDEAKSKMDYFVSCDGQIHPFVICESNFDSDTDEEDDLNDENGRMPEHINQPMDMVDGNGDKK